MPTAQWHKLERVGGSSVREKNRMPTVGTLLSSPNSVMPLTQKLLDLLPHGGGCSVGTALLVLTGMDGGANAAAAAVISTGE